MSDGVAVRTIIKEHNISLELTGAPNFQLHPQPDNHYFIKESDAQITFIEDEKKKPVQLNPIQGADVAIGKFADSDEVTLPAPPLALLTGTYNQPQLGVSYEVVIADSRLIIKLPTPFKKNLGFGELKLTATGGDNFDSDRLGLVEFLRNEYKQISGLKLKDEGRLRNIIFMKIK